MKKSIIATLLCSVLSLAAADHGSGVYLYPEILDSGKNLLAPIENTKAWRYINYPEPDKQLGRTKGGPFDPNGTVFFLNSNTTSSYYWRNYCPLKPNRTYIFGGWVRNTGARILFWFHGNHGKAKKRFNQRIYDLAGINNFIKPYLSPESLKKLAGNYNGWEICYQVFKTPDSEKSWQTFPSPEF